MVFAREASNDLTSLVKKLDSAAAANKKLNTFVVFLNDDEKMEGKLKEMAEKEKVKNVVLAIDNPAGPDGYEINKDADVTVVLYNKRKVEVNHAYRKGELNTAAIEKIISELPKILPAKKEEKKEEK
ncbi:MAG: hypothetical protein K2X38_04110 [Gemmataceae bacterium]|nr:hypothetical protein [Gemmataceae bacterium]